MTNVIVALKGGVVSCVRREAALDYTTRTVLDMERVIVPLKLVSARQVGVVEVVNENSVQGLQNAAVTVSVMLQTLPRALVSPAGWDLLAKVNA